VIVAFLEGDPDRPVIIGCLYNEKNRPTYQLPEGRALSGLRSESGGDNSNEIVFDDANGEELIGIHAAKDFRLTAHETIVLEAPGGFLRIGKEGVTVKSDTPLTWLNCGPGEKDVEAPWE
jgi:type VI secretion system secreted protein VgrG